MKKVLLSAYACSPLRGSEETNGWCWAITLAKRGFEVWCLTNTQDWQEKEETRKRLGLNNLHFICIKVPYYLDETLFRPSSKKIYLHYLLWRKKAVKIVLKLHKEHDFDVAHHVTYGSFQQGSCLYPLNDCKLIFGPVGGGQMALPIFKSYFGSSWRVEIVRGLVSKWLFRFNKGLRETIRKADTVLTINKETEDLLKTSPHYREGQSAMVTDTAIPFAYENLPYREKNPHKTLRILWLGRLLPRKGVSLSLRALSFLPKDMDYILTIVGGGEQERQIDGWIEQFGLDRSKIERRGSIPFTKVSEEYRKADIMLFCSLRDTAGNQVMEAMAHSLPVIVLDISGMVNMVPPDCGIKIEPTTVDGTAQNIARAIEKMRNHEYRLATGRNAHSFAMKNTWDNKINSVTSKYY